MSLPKPCSQPYGLCMHKGRLQGLCCLLRSTAQRRSDIVYTYMHLPCPRMSRMLLQLCMLRLDQCGQALPQSASLSCFIGGHEDLTAIAACCGTSLSAAPWCTCSAWCRARNPAAVPGSADSKSSPQSHSPPLLLQSSSDLSVGALSTDLTVYSSSSWMQHSHWMPHHGQLLPLKTHQAYECNAPPHVMGR